MQKFTKSNKFDSKSDVCFIQGNVFKKIKEIPAKSIDLIITSPPYNLNKEYEEIKAFDIYLEEMEPFMKEIDRVLKKDGAFCLQVGNYVNKGEVFPLDIFFYHMLKKLNYKLRNRIIWHFNSGLHATRRLSGRYETLMWFTKSDDYHFDLDNIRIPQLYQGKTNYKKGKDYGKLTGNPKGKNPSDFMDQETYGQFIDEEFSKKIKSEFDNLIFDFPNVKAMHPEKTSHPCQFPIELVERCVCAFSKEGNIVFDPFVGVGSTLIGALMNSRKAVGCELNKEYMQEAKKRVKLLETGTLPIRNRGAEIGKATGKVAEKKFAGNLSKTRLGK